ncbi:hypothetical protein [Leifsonia virtsii]|uniref:J domain-containing protein n=1 Tax=Leifsonia virtsii TaxID=3035915 RepID=A0ABT8IZ82_9MICO|nr:hypothetical protein [Leifsonia virtsii]MDN4598129.1 hypothetical protein [Leifsonia virtsii]
MSPNEAAELLGVSPTASADEVQRAYASRLGETGGEQQRIDALTAARDALLAASPWRPPAGPQPYPPQHPAAAAAYPPQQPAAAAAYPPQQPAAAAAYPPQQPYPPMQQPTAYAPGYPAYQPTAPQPQPGPGGWYAPPPPPNRRKPMSTGAVVGITLGSIAAGLVVLLVAVFAIASIGASAARVAEAGSSARPTPYQSPDDNPSDGPSDQPPAVEDYDVDGVHVHYVDGWTFELTAAQTCDAATVTAGFADTPDGDTLDEWSTTVDLTAGVPVTFTIPDSASTYGYAGIDSVQCGQA